MTAEKTEFLEKTMLFQAGNQDVIWGIPLNTIEVDAHEVDEYLADGWHAHPFGVRDAQEAAELLAKQKADEEAERKRKDQEAIDEEATLKAKADAAAKADNELKAKLIEEAEGLGLTIDKRWGAKTLQEAIDEAKKSK